jgi:hypothetical protein
MSENGCPLYDELHECCALERMEKIVQIKYRDERPAWDYERCFEEMD